MFNSVQSPRWLAISLILALVGPGVVALLSQRLATDPETLVPRAMSLAMFIGLLIVVATIGRRVLTLDWRHMGFAGSSWRSLLWAVPLAAILIFIYGPFAYWALSALGVNDFGEGVATLQALPTWYLVAAIFIVAGGEEWLYRGFAIERLDAVTGSTWVAGSVSLTAFVLSHLPLWGPGPALTTAVSGGIFTLLYIWKRDVLMLIAAHVVTDLYGIVLIDPPVT